MKMSVPFLVMKTVSLILLHSIVPVLLIILPEFYLLCHQSTVIEGKIKKKLTSFFAILKLKRLKLGTKGFLLKLFAMTPKSIAVKLQFAITSFVAVLVKFQF